MIKVLKVAVLVIVLVFVALMFIPSDTPDKLPVVTEPVETEDPIEGPAEGEAEAILVMLKDGFDTFSVDMEGGVYYFTPVDPAFINDLMSIVGGNLTALAEWDSLVESFVELSEVIYDRTEHGVMMVNPLNPEAIILAVIDGIVVYNLADDL